MYDIIKLKEFKTNVDVFLSQGFLFWYLSLIYTMHSIKQYNIISRHILK